MRKRVLILAALAVVLAACGSPSRVVVMQRTDGGGAPVECRVDPWGSADRTAQIESCVAAYRQAGYTVAGDSHP